MNRPAGVTAIAIYFFVDAFFTFFIACTLIAIPFSGLYEDIGDPIGEYFLTFALTCGVIFVLLRAIALVLAGWGLLGTKQWARWLAFALAIINMFAFPIGTVIGALIIWYLLMDDVKEVFEYVENATMNDAALTTDEVEST
ncbi:hypothetical protein ACFLY4_08370 [Chloroflexota bacterium]